MGAEDGKGRIIETDVYRLTRTDMARLASLSFLRTFWWVAVGIPVGGVLFIIFGRGIMQVIGFCALMWPFSIPARAVISTSRSYRLYVGGVKMTMDEDSVELQGQTPGKTGKRLRLVLPREEVRDVVASGDFLLIRTMHFGFIPVARAAFPSPDDEARFRAEAGRAFAEGTDST